MVLVMVLMMFVVTVAMVILILTAIGESPGFALLIQYTCGVKHDTRITHTDDVDRTRSGQFGIGTDEWHPECMAECVGQADSFLAQRGSAKVAGKTFALSVGRKGDGGGGVDNVSDVVIIAIYVGVY